MEIKEKPEIREKEEPEVLKDIMAATEIKEREETKVTLVK